MPVPTFPEPEAVLIGLLLDSVRGCIKASVNVQEADEIKLTKCKR